MLNRLNFVNCTVTALIATFMSFAATIAIKAEEITINNTDHQENNSEINLDGLDIWSTILDENTAISITESCFDFETHSRDEIINDPLPRRYWQYFFLEADNWEIYKKPIFWGKKAKEL